MTVDIPEDDLPARVTLDQVTPDALCSLGPRPYLLTGAYLQLMRQHFASRDQIEDPVLKHLIWSDQPDMPIAIETSSRWKPDVSGLRPAIIIKRNEFHVTSRGINDQMQGHYVLDGRDFYAAFPEGTHVFCCIDHEEGGAERLANEVYRELIQFGPEIRRSFQLKRFKVHSLGAYGKLEEAAGSYGVPVTVMAAFEECWVITPNAPRLKRIVLSKFLEGLG